MRKELSENTLKQYNYFLNKYKHLDFKNPKLVYETLMNTDRVFANGKGKVSLSCVKIVISAIMRYLRIEQEEKKIDNSKYLQQYKKYVIDMCAITEKKELDHTHNAKDIPNWEDIVKVRDRELKLKHFRNHLVLSLYTYIPPRRLKDYVVMRIVKSAEFTKNVKFNYYIIGTNSFIFNNYKTQKSFMRQEITIPETLKKIMMHYIQWAQICNEELLLNITNYQTLHDIISDLVGCGIDNLRHSYVNYTYKDYKIPDNDKLEQCALAMGHSLQTHLRYRKYENKPDDEKVEDKTT